MPIDKTDKIWMNGELVDWDEAKVHVLTHTLHYGSGVFEGIRAYWNEEQGRQGLRRAPGCGGVTSTCCAPERCGIGWPKKTPPTRRPRAP